MNGVPMEEKYLSPEDFEEQLLTLIMKETQVGGWLIDCPVLWYLDFFQPNCNLKQMSLKSREASNKHCKLDSGWHRAFRRRKGFSLIKKRNNFLFFLVCIDIFSWGLTRCIIIWRATSLPPYTEGGIPQQADGNVRPPKIQISTDGILWNVLAIQNWQYPATIQIITDRIIQILQAIQKAVYRNLQTDSMDMIDHLMSWY